MRRWTGLLLTIVTGLLLTGCGGATTTATVAPEDVPVVTQATDKVVAEAIVEPARWSELSFDIGGDVLEVHIQEGDSVSQGDLLAQLETADLQRAVAQAELNLRQAQLRLDKLQEPPDESAVKNARAAVSDAAAAYQEAQANLTVTEHSVSVGDQVRAARAARDETYRIYQDLQAKFDENKKGVDEHMVTAAHDAYLDALGAYNRAVENAELQVTMARNQVTQAYHALEQAQSELDELLEGADENDIEAAQLEVDAAQLALEEAQDNLEKANLVAPFDGRVTTLAIDPGDSVAPGQAVLNLAKLSELRVRTVDLTEIDVGRVEEGQSATVTADALPEDEYAGVVREIALEPGDYRGDVVYSVTIELTDADDIPLRWGMTAVVEIKVE